MRVEKEYNKMNWLYNALYGDMTSKEIKDLEFVLEHKGLIKEYEFKDFSIIDAACGNGVQATALALNGYKVTATDISEEMVKLTKEFSKKYGVKINAERRSWSELPEVYDEKFDIVLCTGNSLVHSRNKNDRMNNIQSLWEILAYNGTLVIETRNWDKVIKERKEFTVYSKTSYKGSDYIPLYHWILNHMEEEARVEILLQEIDSKGSVFLHQSKLTFTPFSHKSLLSMIKKLNLEITKDTYSDQCDWYYIYAKKII